MGMFDSLYKSWMRARQAANRDVDVEQGLVPGMNRMGFAAPGMQAAPFPAAPPPQAMMTPTAGAMGMPEMPMRKPAMGPQMGEQPQATPQTIPGPSQPLAGLSEFTRGLGTSPLFMGGLTTLMGQGPGAGANLANAQMESGMRQSEWERAQQMRRRRADAWGKVFPGGQPAADHPLLKGMPPELVQLAQIMGSDEGLDFLGKYAMAAKKPLTALQQAQLANLLNPGGVAAAKKAGEMQAEAAGALPGVIADAETALDVINQTRQHPGLSAGTGWSANLPSWSPRARGFDAHVKQLSGQAFLASIQKMRGLGQLSDAEGKAAREAAARLETAQSQEEFLRALDDLEKLIRKGLQSAYSKAGEAPPAAPDTSGWSVEPIE